MKYALNYFIPVVQEDASNLFPRPGYANYVSSSGYYGYQTVTKKQVSIQQTTEKMDTQASDINIQFQNYAEDEIKISNQNKRGQDYRKRAWEYGADAPNSKKRRENEPVVLSPDYLTTTKYINLRQPTHNMPDFPRSIMGHYI